MYDVFINSYIIISHIFLLLLLLLLLLFKLKSLQFF